MKLARVNGEGGAFRDGETQCINLAGSWRLSERVGLTLGIDNLFDRDPNRVGAGPLDNGAGDTVPGYYDVLGRRYFGGIKLDF